MRAHFFNGLVMASTCISKLQRKCQRAQWITAQVSDLSDSSIRWLHRSADVGAAVALAKPEARHRDTSRSAWVAGAEACIHKIANP